MPFASSNTIQGEHPFQDFLSDSVAFNARHLCEEIEGSKLYEEKPQKEKIKTGASALVVCLNLDIDPPDVQKIPPYSRIEAWFDPSEANSLRALETIGKNLQSQYERWQPRARFKQCLDPTTDDVKNLCISLRRNFKSDRILFHYNGHGVPRPTENGEIWVFNSKFTKYIPLSLCDLQRWVGAPAVYVFDCQSAGRVIRLYAEICRRRLFESAAESDQRYPGSSNLADNPHDHYRGTHGHPINTQTQANSLLGGSVPVTMDNTIMLAACQENEDLPQDPDLPADVFTASLTTPIRMALKWHWMRHRDYFPDFFDEALLDRIPGSHSDRMSLLGEINWIFTAVTDTIAWCSFPVDLFQKLFRKDMLVAGLFRNFLLAERIMKVYGCTPVSSPPLSPTFRHPMWNAWDHALDRLVHYLPRMLKLMEGSPTTECKLPIILGDNDKPSNQPTTHIPLKLLPSSQMGRIADAKSLNSVCSGQQQDTRSRAPQVPIRPEVNPSLAPPGFSSNLQVVRASSDGRPMPSNPSTECYVEGNAVAADSHCLRHPAPQSRDTSCPAPVRNHLLEVTNLVDRLEQSKQEHTLSMAMQPQNQLVPFDEKQLKTSNSKPAENELVSNPAANQQPVLRRHPHAVDKLYALQSTQDCPPLATTVQHRAPIPTTLPFQQTQQANRSGHSSNAAPLPAATKTSVSPVYSGSVIGGCGPAAFFTSQMTAFKVWLQTANEKQPPAMQLPILLQILLSQSHRTRAMKLLCEFLDLGPWAVSHCLMVGILPYIARLFSSNLFEVKPHLVFIWGKIIASAQTEFSRNDSVRDAGYKYFVNCLGDTENLSPLTRTITAFALTKMLEKEPCGEPDHVFQELSLKQNFIPLVLSQLYENPPTEADEILIRLRLWLIFALAKLWHHNDQARWFGIRYNVTEALFAYLDDISPEVRAATVSALGSLIDNQLTDESKRDQTDQINQLIATRFVKLLANEACPLVRTELLASFCALVRQFEPQLCAMAHQYLLELSKPQPRQPNRPARHSVVGTVLSSYSVHGLHSATTPSSTNRRKRSEFPQGSIFSAGSTNVYAQFWLALVSLFNDPHPDVAHRGRILVHYILKQTFEKFGHPLTIPSPSLTVVPDTRSRSVADLQDHGLTNPTQPLMVGSATSDDQSKHFRPNVSPPRSSTSPVQRPTGNPMSSGSVTTSSGPLSTEQNTATQLALSSDTPLSQSVSTRHKKSTRPSSFMIHSAQYPGKRHQQVDQFVRLPQMASSSPCPSASPPCLHVGELSSPDGTHPLDRIQRTQFFPWSCSWFAKPLLSFRKANDTPDSKFNSGPDANKLPQHTPDPDPQLIALCSYSTDLDVVVYADRVLRLGQCRDATHAGHASWVRALRLDTAETQTPKPLAAFCSTNLLSDEPGLLRFHPVQSHLVATDSLGGVSVYSWDKADTLNCRSHLIPPKEFDVQLNATQDCFPQSSPSRVTDVAFINCCDERSLLLTCDQDGRIRVWRNYLRDLGQDPEIVTAWTGLSDLSPSNNASDVVVEWSQSTSLLLVGGDSRTIRLWDCARESKLRDFPTGTEACVTSLARSLVNPALFAAGFGEGGVRVFDSRIPSTSSTSLHHHDCNIFSATADPGCIHSVSFSNHDNQLYAVGSTGSLSVWQHFADTANPATTARTPIESRRSTVPKPLSRFKRRSVPPRLSGLSSEAVVRCVALKVDTSSFNSHFVFAGVSLSPNRHQLLLHRVHDGMAHSNLSVNTSTPLCVAVHPTKPLLAAGFKEKSLTLYNVSADPCA